MKDTNQKIKESKKFRLHSILKLHTRIMNQKLMTHAIGLQDVVENLMKADNKEAIKQLLDLSLDFSVTGKHNFEVSSMASKLQLSSSHDELEALFKLVTKSNKSTLKDLVGDLEEDLMKCNCSGTESKNESTKPNTSNVTAKVIEIVASSKEEALEKFKQLMEEGKIK